MKADIDVDAIRKKFVCPNGGVSLATVSRDDHLLIFANRNRLSANGEFWGLVRDVAMEASECGVQTVIVIKVDGLGRDQEVHFERYVQCGVGATKNYRSWEAIQSVAVIYSEPIGVIVRPDIKSDTFSVKIAE
ncbi:TPA: hypothetical protein U2T46_002985 [Burkholderia cenocepacia]|nr:hypothetical protein [Burkholderia cenocepacia]